MMGAIVVVVEGVLMLITAIVDDSGLKIFWFWSTIDKT